MAIVNNEDKMVGPGNPGLMAKALGSARAVLPSPWGSHRDSHGYAASGGAPTGAPAPVDGVEFKIYGKPGGPSRIAFRTAGSRGWWR